MGSLFSGPEIPQVAQAIVPPPVVTPPPVMPVPDDEKNKDARRRAIASQAANRGRQSTILSNDVGNTDTLGG